MLKLAVEINERLQVSLTKLSNQQDWNDEESLFHGWRAMHWPCCLIPGVSSSMTPLCSNQRI